MTILQRAKRTVTLAHDGKTVTYAHAGRGFEYLEELLCHPNCPIMCSHLRQMFQIDPNACAGDDFDEVEAVPDLNHTRFPYLPLTEPIEAADRQTIDDVKQRLLNLIAAEAELMQYHDYARLDDVREEKQALLDYLRQVITPLGRPRFLHHQQRNDYSAVKQAIQRAVAKLEPDFPDLFEDLNANLVFGLSVCYRDPISHLAH
jgi:hypothetical protein